MNALRSKEAEEKFVREQIKAWQRQAALDAGSDYYRPPVGLDRLAEHVYCMAWARQRDKDGRAERDAAEALSKTSISSRSEK